jgi:hypothetical protein
MVHIQCTVSVLWVLAIGVDSTEFCSDFAGSWLGLLAFDTVVFGLTIYNAFITRLRMVPQTPLHILVVHDGAPLSLSFIPQT